jgi:ABC-2 type transport system permease protein
MLGGRLIPLFLFPPLVRSLSNLLPFRYIISFPLEILSGQVSSLEIQQGFLLQVSITTILFGFTAILWHRGIIKYSAIGG